MNYNLNEGEEANEDIQDVAINEGNPNSLKGNRKIAKKITEHLYPTSAGRTNAVAIISLLTSFLFATN